MSEHPSQDAWLLLAVRYAGGPFYRGRRSVRQVIGAADAINHDVPTAAIFQGAIRRLTAADLLKIVGDRLALTDNGRRLIRSVRGGSWFEEWERLTQELSQLHVPTRPAGQELSEDAYARGLAEYLGER